MMMRCYGRCFVLVLSCLLSPGVSALSDMEQYYQALDLKSDGHYAQAVEIWSRLAKLGHGRSQFFLGLMYEEGKGVKPNDRQAIYWYAKAAEQELPDAWLNLGVLYARLKQYHRAIGYFQRCLDNGYEPARSNLRQLTVYLHNRKMVVTKATALRRTASLKAKVIRQLKVGQKGYEMRSKGRWVQVSLPGKPEVGWVLMKHVFSDRLVYEQGVKAHTFGQLKKAFKLWSKLANKGHSKSQIMLARLYLQGEGVAQNADQAIFWSEKALSEGLLSDKVRAFTRQTIRLAKQRRIKQSR